MKLIEIPVKNTKQIISRSIEGSIITINIDNKNSCLLEDFNLSVWKLINGKRNIKEIIKKLSEEFNTTKEKLKKYTIEILNNFKKAEFVNIKNK